MSKPGHYAGNLENIFRSVTGQPHIEIERHMAAQSLIMDFRAAAVMKDSNGVYLEARFVGSNGKAITLSAEDVGRLQQWTNAATIEARQNYKMERNEYLADRREFLQMQRTAHADGHLSEIERQNLAAKRAEMTTSYTEAQSARYELNGFVRQDNELRSALDTMHEAREAYRLKLAIDELNKPPSMG